MSINVVLAILIPLIVFSFGTYIYKSKRLELIASIEPDKVPKEKTNKLLTVFYIIIIFVSITLAACIITFSISDFVGFLFVILMFIEMIYFYIYYSKIIK